jgi:hypothetical protein
VRRSVERRCSETSPLPSVGHGVLAFFGWELEPLRRCGNELCG